MLREAGEVQWEAADEDEVDVLHHTEQSYVGACFNSYAYAILQNTHFDTHQ